MIGERLEEIRKELNAFDDELMKYSFLVELSAYVKPDQPDLMTEENLHHGCQSQVWIRYRITDGKFYMNATSDTLIIRGVLYVMMQLFNGLPPEEIARSRIDFLKECGIAQHFTGSRISGIGGITEAVYTYCDTCSIKSAGPAQSQPA